MTLVKGLLADYEKGDWDSWKEKYADTAKVYYNQWDDSITVTQSMEGHKAEYCTFKFIWIW